ncbi:hypothetical protein MtrunA17_Chr2g0293511 [Medicago truncatula]|uniref:Uncharacterized protein n=1 Tax=Medicago truncatula TaxID=3880 RepID=I3S9C2_MEDTR|nr:unknown [Medicago truncatula]RHN72974.1 hypothetical protein MtrunA17_Chr2g0293511 [Medicago truncatula]
MCKYQKIACSQIQPKINKTPPLTPRSKPNSLNQQQNRLVTCLKAGTKITDTFYTA